MTISLSHDEREDRLLAPYAMHSRDTEGRVYPEPLHPYRGPFARDRDRILHSSAFRRLSGKMQVFTGEMGVYHRTRLTHTFEVASVARTMARSLRLNEDLTEALALMHDIGHPPYGHCGEDALSERMAGVGGFSHNGFALVIVAELEQRYSQFPGLNLSRETLAGQDSRAHKSEAAVGRSAMLEVQLVDAADSIAYDAHDVDDALQMGLLSMDELAELAIVRRAIDRLRDKHTLLPTSRLRQSLVHELIDLQVGDLLTEAIGQLDSICHPKSICHPVSGSHAPDDMNPVDVNPVDVNPVDMNPVGVNPVDMNAVCESGLRFHHSPSLQSERDELESFLFDAVYRHPRLIPVRAAASNRLRTLFDHILKSPNRLPLRFRERAERVRIERVAGEYLAGMTDSFCDDQFQECTANDRPLADW